MKRKLILMMLLTILTLSGCEKTDGAEVTLVMEESEETQLNIEEEGVQESEELPQLQVTGEPEPQEEISYDWQEILTLSANSLPDREAVESILLQGPEGIGILDWVQGDIGLDGKEDIVVIYEFPFQGELVRKTAIFTKIAEQYECNVLHETLIPERGSGGVFGDPYNGIQIDEETGDITFSIYGGSAWRWGIDIRFGMEEGKLLQREYKELSHCTHADGTVCITHYYDTQNTKCYAYWYEDKEECEALLYSYDWEEEVQAPEFVEVESMFGIQGVPSLEVPLPSWEDSTVIYQGRIQDATFSASDILDEVKDSFNPDMRKIEYDASVICVEGISSYFGYDIPPYYYENERGEQLYYKQAEYSEEGWIHQVGICDAEGTYTEIIVQ